MNGRAIIVARTIKAGHEFAREALGLTRSQYTVATSAASIRAVMRGEVHLVPGWDKRPDRFSIKSALRWTRLTVIEHDEVEKKAEVNPLILSPEEQINLQEFFDSIPLEDEAVPQVSSDDTNLEESDAQAGTPESGEDSESAPEPERPTRRRRCKPCGELFDAEEIDAHRASCTGGA